MTDKPRPNANTSWGLRPDVKPIAEQIAVVHDGTCRLFISRKDARLLAKRINQCLDETRR